MNIFVVTTSYTFEFALITMIAATIYFFLERYSLSDEYKPVSTLAILTTALAVVEYYNMRDFFSLENLSNPLSLLEKQFYIQSELFFYS